MNKIISIWGNPNSGKTTLAIKLAKELTKRNKSVILVFGDLLVPTVSTVLPFIESEDKSLGALLSDVQITQDLILKKCIPLKEDKNLCVLSHLHGENERTYAQYQRERVVDLLILLKHLADHIIIDCSSQIYQDLFMRTVIEASDRSIRLMTPDLKAISYFDSCTPLLKDKKYNLSKHINVLSKICPSMPKDQFIDRWESMPFELDHTMEIEEQFIQARLFEPLITKASMSYVRTIEAIADELIGVTCVENKNIGSKKRRR